MSTDPSMKPIPDAVLMLQSAAKTPVAHQAAPLSDVKQDAVCQEEQPSSDVLAFCTLLARIVMRCLNQRDARVLKVLSLPSRQRKINQE